jgi:hypothetical protein
VSFPKRGTVHECAVLFRTSADKPERILRVRRKGIKPAPTKPPTTPAAVAKPSSALPSTATTTPTPTPTPKEDNSHTERKSEATNINTKPEPVLLQNNPKATNNTTKPKPGLPQNAKRVSRPSTTARTQEEKNPRRQGESNSTKDKEIVPEPQLSFDNVASKGHNKNSITTGQKVAAKAKRSRKEENQVAAKTANNKRRKKRNSGQAAVAYAELPTDSSPPDSSDDEALTANIKRGINEKQFEEPQLTKAEATAPPIRITLESLKVVQAYCEAEGIGEDLCETLNTQIRNQWFEKALVNFLPTVFE